MLNIRYCSSDMRAKPITSIERVVHGECLVLGTKVESVIEYSDHGEVTDNDPEALVTIRPVVDAVLGNDSTDAVLRTVSKDFSGLPRGLNYPYIYWTVGAIPRDMWTDAVAVDCVVEDVPSNHTLTFLLDSESTAKSVMSVAIAAVLFYLVK